MGEVTFQEEDPLRILEEAMPLFREHWQEIAHYHDIPLEPDLETYRKATSLGAVKVYTAREGGALIGYAAYFVRPNMHYRSSLQANQDVLFVSKAKRRGTVGIRLIAFADDALRALGVQVVTQHVKVAHDFGPLLQRLGYQHIEHIYAKRLDRE